MKNLLIKNGTIVTLGTNNQIIHNGSVLIRGEIIDKISSSHIYHKDIPENTEIIDANGKLIMPGFINMHMHFYSTFARGIIPKQPPAKNFVEILEKLWWPLDKVLTDDDLYYSTLVPLITGIKNGVTTFFDHHESQGFQNGCLKLIEDTIRQTGIRACLCLGTSDRYKKGKQGLEENIRCIEKIKSNQDDLITAMIGLHAMFTVNDDTLNAATAAAKKCGTGIHIHIAEDKADQITNQKKYKKSVLQRLYEAKGLGEKTLAVHCVHVSDEEIKLLKKTKTNVIHNPQSNMNNAVGVAPIIEMLNAGVLVGLGTDGMTPRMQDDVRVANILHKLNQKDPNVFFVESCKLLLENNAKIASKFYPKKLGVLEPGAYADVILVDYSPPTPLNENTFLGHFLFGICEAKVDTTIVNGKILMKNGKLLNLDEATICAFSREQASDFWKRFAKI